RLEQAARGLGASRWRLLRTVTLPLATPGLLAAGLFIAIGVLGDFGNPMLVGGRFRVLATEVYTELTGWASVGTSAALGLVLLVPAVLLFAAQQRVQTATAGRFLSVGGRGSGLAPPLPPAGLRTGLFVVCALVTLFVVASQGVVVAGSITRIWGVDYTLTADHYEYVTTRMAPLLNSIKFAALAAVLGSALAAVTSFVVHRTGLPLKRGLDLATLLPAAVPGTLMGVAYVLVFNRQPLQLTGTGVLIVVAMAVSYLPVGYRILAASLQQVRPSLDESAANLGASRTRTFLTVLVPLLWPAIAAAFAFTFVQAVGTLSTVIFLVSFDTPLASVDILNLAAQGRWGRACALATALLVVTGAALTLAYAVTGGRMRPFEAATGRAGG
ncbi:MAG TPA: ABC transporter permease subunit, partial [Trueperaceae bacterium]